MSQVHPNSKAAMLLLLWLNELNLSNPHQNFGNNDFSGCVVVFFGINAIYCGIWVNMLVNDIEVVSLDVSRL